MDNEKRLFMNKAESLAEKGMRVLALAYKDVPFNINSISNKSSLNLESSRISANPRML